MKYEEVVGSASKQINFAQVEIPAATFYAAEDADITLRLFNHLNGMLKDQPKLTKLLTSIEYPMLKSLIRVETNGAKIDGLMLSEYSDELAIKIEELSKAAFKMAGEEFNMDSPKQLVEILYNKLDLPVLKKTPKGQPSTNEDTLQRLAEEYDLPKIIIEYRGLAKLKSTYTDSLIDIQHPVTKRIHTSYQQAVTSTGRLSSTEPNLQNIPIKTAEGRKIREAFISGKTIDEVFEITKIDPWFLFQIKKISEMDLTSSMIILKENGFSDAQISKIRNQNIEKTRRERINKNIIPSYKLVDTCAAEFIAKTPYCYSTYDDENEIEPLKGKKIMVLGGGPNRIGQGIEFDYCCVQAVFGLKELGYKTIMVNCNPETVSTDFDLVDRLYFEPVTFEDVMNIIDFEKPDGVLVQFGGQTPLKISKMLLQAGAPIIGTSPANIDVAEDREKFGKILTNLNILCPTYGTGKNLEQVVEVADRIGYPVLARPSYVLGGRAMEIVYSQEQLIDYIARSADVTKGHPILIDQFLEDAFEFDVDALCDGEEVYIGAIMQHIEEAGIHSGDSACVLPPYQIKSKTINEIERITSLLAIELNVLGLLNIQFAYKNNDLYVLEVNPRASRTIPFVSKTTNVPLAKIAAQISVGSKLKDYNLSHWNNQKHIAIKEAVLPFNKFPSESIFLGPEMKSTGEVMGLSDSFGLSYYKATLSAGSVLPDKGIIFVSVYDDDKFNIIPIVRGFVELGFKLIATKGTSNEFRQNGINSDTIFKVGEGRPNIVDYIKNNQISLVINTPLGAQARFDEESIGKACIKKGILAITTIFGAEAVLSAIRTKNKIKVKPLQEYF